MLQSSSWGSRYKALSAAVMTSLLFGGAVSVGASAPITGALDLTADYTAEATEPNAKNSGVVAALYNGSVNSDKNNPTTVNLQEHTLNLNAASSGKIADGIFIDGTTHFAITNGGTINITSTNTDTRAANGIYINGDYATLDLGAQVNINKVHTAGQSASGIAFQGKNSVINIDGGLSITDVDGDRSEKRGRGINVSGISVTGDGSGINVESPVNITGIKGSAIALNGDNTYAKLAGGTISAAEDADKSHNYYAVRVEKGTVSINVDGTAPTENTTRITGDMYINGQYGKKVIEYSDGELVGWTSRGQLNVALNDKDSFWKGVAAYGQYNDNYGSGGNTFHDVGELNLWLSNGAQWTNEAQSHVTQTTLESKNPVYEGSYVTNFHGGTKEAPGYIYQKDSHSLTFANYDGHTVVYYDHSGDGTAEDSFSAGDTRIHEAKAGSSITLRTGAESISMDDKSAVDTVLGNLAKKLYYEKYADGNTNLTGTVEIAEGLTSSSARASGVITFTTNADSKKNGQGSYVPEETGTERGPIIKSETLPEKWDVNLDKTAKNVGSYTAAMYSEADDTTADNPMVVDLNGHDLSLNVTDAPNLSAGIYGKEGSHIHVRNDKNNTLAIHVENNAKQVIDAGIVGEKNSEISIDGPVEIDGITTISQSAYGIWAKNENASIKINGPLTMSDIKGTKVKRDSSPGVYANGQSSAIVITGDMDISGLEYGHALRVNGKNTGKATIKTSGGRISMNKNTGSAQNLYLAYAANGDISLNETDEEAGIKSSSLAAEGDVYAGNNGIVSMNLSDGNSSWAGISNLSGTGIFNLALSNGGLWTVDPYTKAGNELSAIKVSSLTGGKDAAGSGTLYMKSDKPVTVDNYSGALTVYYDHTADATDTMIGGNLTISKAAEGSTITLRTGNEGLNTGSNAKADVDKVNASLTALANKLYYSAYANGEKNLSGTVEIAEGLTSSSVLKKGLLSFLATGQGTYDPKSEVKSKFTSTLYGLEAKDTEYINGGIRGDDGIYTFKDAEGSTITVDDADKTSEKIGYYPAVGAIVGNGNDITIKNTGKKLSLETVAGSGNQAIGLYSNKNISVDTPSLAVNAVSTGKSAYGFFLNQGGKAEITGNVSIRAMHMADGSATGVYLYYGGSSLTVGGNLTMGTERGAGDAAYGVTAAQKSGWSTKAYDAKGVNIYDRDGASLTVKGDTYIGVKGIGVDMRGSDKNKVSFLGKTTILTPIDTKESSYQAISAAKGTLNAGVTEDGKSVNGKDVNVTGSIYYSDGNVNLGLGTKDSSFTGVVEKGYEAAGSTNIYLQNGAIWKNQQTSLINGFDGTTVTKLVGGADESSRGILYQKDTNPITVENYSGHILAYYDHTGNGQTSAQYTGGSLTIKNADAGSSVTMRTDASGIDTTNKTAVDAVLNALAGKLYYMSKAKSLTGTVEIAEGLTSSSVSKSGDITFLSTGQGSYVPKDEIRKDFTHTLYGLVAKDTEYVDAGIRGDDGIYTFKDAEGSTITVDDADKTSEEIAYYPASGAIVGNGNDITIRNKGKKLSLKSTVTGKNIQAVGLYGNKNITVETPELNVDVSSADKSTTGFFLHQGGKAEITGNVSVKSTHTGAGSAYGVRLYYGGSSLTIGGNLSMGTEGGTGDEAYGVTAAQKSGYSTKKYDAEGVYIYDRDGASLTVKGDTYIGVKGIGIDMRGSDKNKVTLLGKTTILTPVDTGEDSYQAISAARGTLNAGMKEDGTTVNGKDLNVTGSVYYDSGIVNLGFGTKDSNFTGIVNKSSSAKGVANLYLQNGAVWNNQLTSSMGSFTGTTVTKLTGGTDEAGQGFIYQKDSNPITVENYSGYTTVIYDHNESTPTTMTGGDFKIEKASAGSGITLLTDNKGITKGFNDSDKAADKNKVSAVLNALANKLWYMAGDNHLTGKVEIAEGLTTSSKALKTGNISYSTTNTGTKQAGQGYYDYTPVSDIPESQTQDHYGTAILGSEERDAIYVNTGVLKNGLYNFTKDTTIAIDGTKDTAENKRDKVLIGPWFYDIQTAISGSVPIYDEDGNELISGKGQAFEYLTKDQAKANNVTMDMNGHKLVVNVKYEGSAGQAGIAAVGAHGYPELAGKVEINNAGAMNVIAKGSAMTAGLYADGGGKLYIHNGGDDAESKVLTIRGGSKTKASGVGIKTMNGNIKGNSGDNKHSEITIDGLVNVVADGKADEEGYSSNEAVSAVASDINIGGGTIKAINGAWAAIRAYGEFTTPNYGIVNVNADNREYSTENAKAMGGNVTIHKVKSFEIGSNKVIIEGDLATNGGMGTKGQINIGMGKDSHWIGNYADTRGYGVTQGQLGAVNVKMKDGAYWKGFGNGAMNVEMTGKDTNWLGFNIGDKMQLTLKDGATWYNAITPGQKDQSKKDTEGKVAYLTSDNGIIDMTGAHVFTASGNSLSGRATADGASAISESENGTTGNVNVSKYSGSSTVIYKHEIVDNSSRDNASLYGNKAANVIGGDFKITKAAEKSEITLLTDNTGVKTDSTVYTDRNLVNDLLDKLANKLFYTGYTDGHLKGYAEIASGLTTSSVKKKIGDISFYTAAEASKANKTEGEGYYKYDLIYPDSQVKNPMDTTIDGSADSEEDYKEAGIYKDDKDVYDFTKDPSTINGDKGAAIDAGTKDITVDSGEGKLILNGGDNGTGVKASDGKAAEVKGDADITGKTGISAEGTGSAVNLHGITDITAGEDGIVAKNGGSVTADKAVTVNAGENGKAIDAGKDSTVTLNGGGTINGNALSEGGTITAKDTEFKKDVTASDGGTVSLNGSSVAGKTTASGANSTVTTNGTNLSGAEASNGGSLKLTDGTISGDVKTDKDSTAAVTMDKAGAFFKGNMDNDGTASVSLTNGGSWTGDSKGSGKTDVTVGKGSTWTGASANENTSVDLAGNWKQTGDSKVADLKGQGGTLDKSSASSGKTDITHYSGNSNIIYSHNKNNPTEVYGGDTTIQAADKGSSVNMITDNQGLKTGSTKAADRNAVSEAMNALANKLYYNGDKGNLTGKLSIAEGLSTSSASIKTGALSFKDNGQGFYDYTKAIDIEPEIGDYETKAMKITKSAIGAAILAWRSDMNDMYKRLGDLHAGAESGIWARTYGGRFSYNHDRMDIRNDFWAVQTGADKRLKNGWHVGGAFGYYDGDAKFENGAKGDPKLYTLAAYGTKVSEDGQYVDIVLKGGNVQDKFHGWNEGRLMRFDGKYDTSAFGISAEYGRKFQTGKGFITPQAELAWSHIASDNFTVRANNGDRMKVEQSGVDSLIGRLGVAAGVENDRGNLYFRASLFHEFDGDGHTWFRGTEDKRTSFDLGDTWTELSIGGNYNLSPTTSLYADFTRSFGGDYKVNWKVNAGVRFRF